MKHGARLSYAIAVILGAVSACGVDASSFGGLGTNDGSDPGQAAGGSAGTSSSGSPQLPPPEKEADRVFQVPVVSGHWVWTANPRSGRVALIDAQTFTVKTALAGAQPTYLAALPVGEVGGSRAIVINSASQDATLLSASGSGEVEVSATLPVHPGANAWAITPDGRFALAWTDAGSVARPDPSEGFQDITVLDLGSKERTSKRLSVGYRPARVFVANDNRYAYVVTDAGIDIVDLKSSDGPIVERALQLSDDPANDTARREVNVTPDGAFAFVSRAGKDYLTVVNVKEGARVDVLLPGIVTDLDLSPDASMAVAIIRDRLVPAAPVAVGVGEGGQAGQRLDLGASGGGGSDLGGLGGAGSDLGAAGQGSTAEGGAGPGSVVVGQSLAVLLPVASIFEEPKLFDTIALDELFGSVELGADGRTALLYSNGAASTHLTLLSLAQAEAFRHRTLDLKLPVFSIVSSPDGAHAVALLMPQAGSKQPGAFAVVPVAKDLPAKIQGTQARTVPMGAANGVPAMVAIDDTRALVTVTDGASANWSYLVSMPELTVDPFALASVPLPQSSGLVPEANQAFVAQQHPEGRITFIDLTTKQQHTLTGFELSARVGK